MNGTAEIPHVDPASPSLYCGAVSSEEKREVKPGLGLERSSLLPEYLALQPGQVVDPHSVLLPGYCDEDVLALQDLHLLEPPPGDQLVDFPLARPVQQHQTVFSSNEEIDSPQSGAQNLRVEPFLVFPDLRRVGSEVVSGSHVDVDVTLSPRRNSHTAQVLSAARTEPE